MAGMDHSRMQPSTGDSSAVDHSKMDHARMAGDSAKPGAVDHAKMDMAGMRDSADAAHSQLMMDVYMRMMADPVIRARVMADTAMRRMMTDMIDEMPVEHREHLQEMMRDTSAVKGRTAAPTGAPSKRPPVKKPAATKKPAPQPKDTMPGMDHSKMPGMKKP